MNMDDWGRIAEDIGRYYKDFDGFVVLHGTDTMCYTASALSFMLEHLGKPVIITGAQVNPLLSGDIPRERFGFTGKYTFANKHTLVNFCFVAVVTKVLVSRCLPLHVVLKLNIYAMKQVI